MQVLGGDVRPLPVRQRPVAQLAGERVATASASAIPEELQGEFEREVSAEDNRAAGATYGAAPAGIPPGAARMIVEPDGLVSMTHADGGDEELTFVVPGDRVKVTGGSYCADPAASSTYRWSRSGGALAVKPMDNDCPDRQAVLTGTWHTR